MKKGVIIELYNTTCPFVEKVWNRAQTISKAIIQSWYNGKPQREEAGRTVMRTFAHQNDYQ